MISSENGLLVVTVLLNVRGRDVGSFVEEARRVIAERVALPQGSYIEWSGQYENERRARERLQIVIPLVLIVIFVLLYLTYRSVLDAAQVLLAVPFGLAGGIYLLYALGYNFSVAVWVGFIALFGTAVQTAVVMVIYLEEAVSKKREALDGRLTREALMEAVKEGALLRLRPKVMTVSTVVASLLPIMWSHSTGAEVMKPLATPVLGGMVSSLGLVLIVTPVIFYWLRERELRTAQKEGTSMRHVTAVVVAVVLLGVGTVWAAEKTVATKKTKDVVVTLKSESGQWKEGKNSFVLELTSPTDQQPVDARKVSVSTSMAMPGMAPMIAGATLTPEKPGRYTGTIEFPDRGTRQVTVTWDGPAGKGSTKFSVPVR